MSDLLARLDNATGLVFDIAEEGPASEMATLFKDAAARIRELEQELGNLLAIIHRDGGHHIQEHGWDKSVQVAREWIYRHLGIDDAAGDEDPVLIIEEAKKARQT